MGVARPKCLDLFCGAGGAAMGLYRAGFDIVGIDIKKQARYPFPFIQADALRPSVRLEHFDLIWASPPCQAFSTMKSLKAARVHPNIVPQTRAAISGSLYVIENVPGAPLESAFTLCGSHFRLRSHRGYLRRHRKFEANFFVPTHACTHDGLAIGVYGHGQAGLLGQRMRTANVPEARILMGMPWAGQTGLSQAIPPAYSEHIGYYAMMALGLDPDAMKRDGPPMGGRFMGENVVRVQLGTGDFCDPPSR